MQRRGRTKLLPGRRRPRLSRLGQSPLPGLLAAGTAQLVARVFGHRHPQIGGPGAGGGEAVFGGGRGVLDSVHVGPRYRHRARISRTIARTGEVAQPGEIT